MSSLHQDCRATIPARARRNTVSGNTAWAAVSLYGASHWTIADNTVSHPAGEPPQPYHLRDRPERRSLQNDVFGSVVGCADDFKPGSG